MNITSDMVRDLREKTGAGMMDCKKALAEAHGDLAGAVEILRKKGIATAEKKSGRAAADGLIGAFLSPDAKLGVLVEVNCETDFVTKLEGFQGFVRQITDLVRDRGPADLDALLNLPQGGSTVRDAQTALVAKIGENLGVRRFSRVQVDGSRKLSQYLHAGSKIGVIVAFDDPGGKLDATTAKEISMHVAAMSPQYVRRDQIAHEILAKEKEIVLAQMGEIKKPPEVLEKIVQGKLGKFFTEVCLDDQLYVRDPEGKASVSAWLKKIDGSVRIESFVRLQVGEGVERRA